MLTCCLDCKKHADNISSKKWPWWIKWLEVNQDVLIVWLINQDFQNKGLIKKVVGIILIKKVSYTSHYKTC